MLITQFLKGANYLKEQLQGEGVLDTFQWTRAELFLYIGQHPKCTQAEIERSLGMPGGQLSRYTKSFTLSIKGGVKQGLDLLDLDLDYTERRRYVYSLNKRGQSIFDTFRKIIGDL